MKRIRNQQEAMRLKLILPFLFLSHPLFPKSWNFSVCVPTLRMYSSPFPNWPFGPICLDWISMPCKDHSIDLTLSVKCYLPRHAVDTMDCLLTALSLYWYPCLPQVAQLNHVWCKKNHCGPIPIAGNCFKQCNVEKKSVGELLGKAASQVSEKK